MHTKFLKDWFRHSIVASGGIHRHTGRISLLYISKLIEYVLMALTRRQKLAKFCSSHKKFNLWAHVQPQIYPLNINAAVRQSAGLKKCAVLPVNQDIVTYISDFRRGFGLANRFIGYSPVVTTINYNTFKITIIITHK
jgi:hypothetical protein